MLRQTTNKDAIHNTYQQTHEQFVHDGIAGYRNPRVIGVAAMLENRKLADSLKKMKPAVKRQHPEIVDDDPKPKLYRIDWANKAGENKHRYVAAIDKVIATTLFDKKYGKGEAITKLNINRVPSDWNVRFPAIWDRIGIAIEETHADEIAAVKKKSIEAAKQAKQWMATWIDFWHTIGQNQEDDLNRWNELRKVRLNDWLLSLDQAWKTIGEKKWIDRTRFDFIEID